MANSTTLTAVTIDPGLIIRAQECIQAHLECRQPNRDKWQEYPHLYQSSPEHSSLVEGPGFNAVIMSFYVRLEDALEAIKQWWQQIDPLQKLTLLPHILYQVSQEAYKALGVGL